MHATLRRRVALLLALALALAGPVPVGACAHDAGAPAVAQADHAGHQAHGNHGAGAATDHSGSRADAGCPCPGSCGAHCAVGCHGVVAAVIVTPSGLSIAVASPATGRAGAVSTPDPHPPLRPPRPVT